MVSVTLTACDRLDLLERTINSFVKYNTYPIHEFLVRDDSGLESVWNQTKILMSKLPYPHVLLPGGQLGQAKSIDRLVARAEGDYIFHLEDDWEFDRVGFIEDCFFAIDWENKWGWGTKNDFSQVRVRHHDDGSATQKNPFTNNVFAYHCTNHLFSFNPHLRRKDFIDKFEGLNETDLGKLVEKKRLKTLWLKEGYCRHIGGDKPTNRAGTSYHSGILKA